ncbi:hypothetical protein GOODEAATRI_018124, partial [Goodea atripinnis]
RVPATQDSRAYAMLGAVLSTAVLLAGSTPRPSAGMSSTKRLEFLSTLPHGTQPA